VKKLTGIGINEFPGIFYVNLEFRLL